MIFKNKTWLDYEIHFSSSKSNFSKGNTALEFKFYPVVIVLTTTEHLVEGRGRLWRNISIKKSYFVEICQSFKVLCHFFRGEITTVFGWWNPWFSNLQHTVRTSRACCHDATSYFSNIRRLQSEPYFFLTICWKK